MKGLLPYFAVSCFVHGVAVVLLFEVSLPWSQGEVVRQVVLVTLPGGDLSLAPSNNTVAQR